MKDDSKCLKIKAILCDFKRIGDYHDAIVEICTQCGKKVIYNKYNGRIDDAKYTRYHRRDILQPRGRDYKLFMKIYGMEAIKRSQSFAFKAKDTRTFEEIRRDIARDIKRTTI